jgi:hypothetical protein
MTKKSKPNKSQEVHDCWMKGMRPEATAQHLQLSYKYVKIRYADFIFFAEKLNGNNKEERIIQIRAIERELFTLIEKNPKDKRIDDLAYTYKTFLI